jgi:hypothetical protein
VRFDGFELGKPHNHNSGGEAPQLFADGNIGPRYIADLFQRQGLEANLPAKPILEIQGFRVRQVPSMLSVDFDHPGFRL